MPNALIIGAGEGFSASLARLLTRNGYSVALAARNTAKLAALAAETGASLHACDVTQRAEAALQAGCDMVLVCNRPDLADELLHNLNWSISAVSLARLARMHGHHRPPSRVELHEDAEFMRAVHAVANVGVVPGDLNLALKL